MRSANNYDKQAESLHTSTDPSKWDDPIVAVQDNSGNVNVIAHQMMATGMIPQHQLVPLTNFELTEIDDYADGLRKIQAANHAFMLLPPEFRATFDNDPYKAQQQLAGLTYDEIKEKFNAATKKTPANAPSDTAGERPIPLGGAGDKLPAGAPASAPDGAPQPTK